MKPTKLIAVQDAPRDLNARDDDDLILLAAGDREDAFETLVQRHMPGLLRYCSKQVCDKRLGEEIAQDTWLQIWAYRERYRAEGKFRVLLYTSARNLCRNQARNSARRSRWFSELEAPLETARTEDESQLDSLIEKEKASQVQNAMAALRPKFREALLLRYDQGLDYREISMIVGRSESTVRSRIFHGLKKLRQRIGEAR